MVSSLLVDSITDPTSSLILLFKEDVDSFPKSVTSHFNDVFKSQHAFDEIPVCDVHNPPQCHPDRALVRFRAMVQDTSPGPELYVAKHGSRPGGWGLPSDGDELQYANLRECTVIWAVNIPGKTEWCSEALAGDCATVRSAQPESLPHKFSIPGAHHVGIQVKIYDTTATLKPTDILTFVGILTSEPLHSERDDERIQVPTLHVLFSRPLSPALVPRPYPSGRDDILQIREDLLSWIAHEALGGDRDAAEWVLLASIARVQSRTPPILPPSLTLCRFPPPPAPSPPSSPHPALTHVLSLLLPIVLTIPLSLPLLNTHPFAPESKNEDLHAGMLQLPAGSRIILTEAGVQEGTLSEKGIANLRATQEVIGTQRLTYKFPFSEFTFETDIGVVVLSEGKTKSAFFQTRATVPLQRTDGDGSNLYKSAEEVRDPGLETLEKWRALIGGALVSTERVLIGEGTSKYIQDDFVRERQRSKEITSEDLSLRMVLAKAMALSMHRIEVTRDVWERVKALDERRKAGLAL